MRKAVNNYHKEIGFGFDRLDRCIAVL